ESAERIGDAPLERRHARAEPGQQLPVAARPAMLARGVDAGVAREVLEQHDVGGERDASEAALEEIVRQQTVLGHPSGERVLEGVDVVDSLAGVGTLVEEILVDVRYRSGIRVETGRSGEQPLVERLLAAL